MINELFVIGSAILLAFILYWGCRYLPGERWQIIASLPMKKNKNGSWSGVNITYYGFLIACAQVIAVSVFCVLMGALSVPLSDLAMLASGLLFMCIIASKVLARVVEKKQNTFTVGGAAFAGIIIAPFIVMSFNTFLDNSIPVLPFMAALTIAYSLGEGLGRLACLSFGCCYGQPLSKIHPFLARCLKNVSISFDGMTKKVSYEAGLEGVLVVPVQAMTSILYVFIGLLGVYLFLNEEYGVAFIFLIIVTQGWRFFSEMLRADHRGQGKITAYQCMSIIAVLFAIGFQTYLPHSMQNQPELIKGLKQLWNPAWIVFIQVLWLTVFFYLGKSKVTEATISFDVRHDKI
jgi:prolipoprotein diacylglyceryltransferase